MNKPDGQFELQPTRKGKGHLCLSGSIGLSGLCDVLSLVVQYVIVWCGVVWCGVVWCTEVW